MKSPYLLSSVAGLLIGTSYIPFPPWAIFFGFVPLWFAWMNEASAKRIFWLGWLTQFVLTLIGFNWVAHTVHEFGHLPWIVSVVILFGFCGFSTLSIPISGVLWFWFCRRLNLREGARALALPVFMTAGERTVPMLFDWHLGYTWLWAKLPGFHLADLIGFSGLSTIGLFANAAVLFVVMRARRRRSWMIEAAAIPLALVALNFVGAWHGRGAGATDASTRVQIVQANIENEDKLMAESGANFGDVVLERFTELTRAGLGDKPDFTVWPETAFPGVIADRSLRGPLPRRLRAFVEGSGVNLITGGYGANPRTGQMSNAFFLIGQNGEQLAEPYRKTMLLAFGEYFPGGALVPRLHEWFPEVGNFERGRGPTVMSAGELTIGPQICYEGLFDWFARGLARRGARIIVNITNDSWYGTWEEPFQHLYMTLARAVEVRRPLVRSTNTGISTVALASGEVLEQSPMHRAWQRTYDVPYLTNPPLTVFSRWGYWLIPAALPLLLAGIAVRGRSARSADDKLS